MAEETSLRTSDPVKLRALAHPLRVEMLAILESGGEHTASEIAQRLGQTVANCSYHLRTLEKHGYVARGAQRGREKPWRAVYENREHLPDPADAESVTEAANLAAMYVQRAAARLVATFDDFDQKMAGPKWVAATRVVNSEFWATAEEMQELAERMSALVEPFAGRRDPDRRPAGARRGFLFAAVNPDPDGTRDG